MHRLNILAIALLMTGLIFAVANSAEGKNLGNRLPGHHGGKAAGHMSRHGLSNGNAQWSADPSRGWVRAQERHEPRRAGKVPALNGDKGHYRAQGKTKVK